MKYSLEDIRKLGSLMESHYNFIENYSIDTLESCIETGTDEEDILKSFIMCTAGGLGADVLKIAYEEPLKNMACYIGDESPWKRFIAEWRFIVNK
jgi:hypothetical protein